MATFLNVNHRTIQGVSRVLKAFPLIARLTSGNGLLLSR